MTEDEYVNATNLAKARAALAIIREINPLTDKQQALKQQASRSLTAITNVLEKIVKVSP